MISLPDVSTATHFPLPESATLEFKEGLKCAGTEKFYPTICGILNAGGGYLVVGVHDGSNEIVGVKTTGKDYDRFVLAIDDIYHTTRIKTMDAPEDPLPLGTVTTSLVPAAGGEHLMVVTITPAEGKRYTTGGAVWHRLGASTYRERSPKEVFTQGDMDEYVARTREAIIQEFQRNMQSERGRHGSQMIALKADYAELLGAAKAQATELQLLRTDVAAVRDLLYKDILERKAAAEAALTEEKKSRWCW